MRLFLTASLTLVLVSWMTPTAHALPASKRLDQCRLDTWGIRDGLPGYDITALTQTPDGFLWIGTTQGLLRFDGAGFTIFNNQNVKGLTNNTIRGLAVDLGGRLLVGTEWCGYGRLTDGAYQRANFPDDHWNATRYFHNSPDGSLWVGYQGYGYVLRERSGHVDKIVTSGLYPTGVVDTGAKGSVLVSMMYGGLFTVDNTNHAAPFHTVPAISATDFTGIARAGDGSIWCSTDTNGLYRIKGKVATHFDTSNGLCSNTVHCLFVDNAKRLWIGTNAGVACYDKVGFHHYGIADGLAADDVTAIGEDREGDLWVATGVYLNRFANTRLTAISIGSRDLQEIGGLSPTADGNLYYAARSGLWSVPPRPDGVPKQLAPWPVKLATTGPDGKLYAAYQRAGRNWVIGRLDGGKWSEQAISFEPLKLMNLDGKVLVVGVHQEIMEFGAQNRSLVYPVSQDSQFYDARIDRHDTLWIGCNQGLAYYRNGKGGVAQCGLPSGAHVLSVDTSDPQYLWLGTDKGIARVDGAAYSEGTGDFNSLKSTLYGVEAGVPSNDCLQLLRDDGGNIWVGGYFGIMSVSPDQFTAYDNHKIKSLSIRLFTAADGIHYYPIVAMPARTSDGKLWFQGTRGVTMIDPGNLDHNPLPPPLSIEEAGANGVALPTDGLTRVNPGAGTFTARYSGLSYVEPEKVKFRYKLEGFDDNWTAAGTRRSVNYTNLPPGRYTFLVTACNNDGIWNSRGASVTFELLPHFYQTAWFRVLIGVFLAVVLAAIVVFRTRRIEVHARQLEVKVDERTSELVHTNRQLTTVQEELRTQNVQLQESQAEVLAQNDELHSMQIELMAQNDQLQSVQAELEAQNQELVETQDFLADANSRLEGLATTDGLTGLFNHRTFHEQLDNEWSRAARYGTPLSLILLDVDRFKQFNDTFGHPAGDEVLRIVAKILKSSARQSDLIARYGGEEFVVIAPETDIARAAELAERLRAALEASEWQLRSVTGSFGVATVDASTSSPAALISHADTALYQSKNDGRNRVSVFSAQPTLAAPATDVAGDTPKSPEQRAA